MSKPKRGYVYLAVCDDGAVMKIGYTTQPKQRYYNLKDEARRAGMDGAVRMIRLAKGTPELEQQLLLRAKSERCHGNEWMLASPDLLAMFNALPRVTTVGMCQTHRLFMCSICPDSGKPVVLAQENLEPQPGAVDRARLRAQMRRETLKRRWTPTTHTALMGRESAPQSPISQLRPFIDYQPINLL